MMDLDKELKNLKENELKAPPEFEKLMKESLDNAKRETDKKKIPKFNNKYLKIALIFIAFIFIFNLDVVSATIKNLVGYNDYFSYNSYVKKLNERGELQDVNKKIEFSNGKNIAIEGIVYDNKYVVVFMRGNIEYTDEYVETNEAPEEYEDTTSKSSIRVLNGEITSGSSLFKEKDANGDNLVAQTFQIGGNKESFTLEIIEEGESKEITIDIDSSKVIKVKSVKPENNEIEIDGVKFIVNELRVSPLGVNLDYSVVSKDIEKVKEIQRNNSNFFNKGINFMPIIEGKNIDQMGVLANEKVEKIDNGIRVVEKFVLRDLAIDKFNKAKIIIQRANFSEDLKVDNKGIKDKKINDKLFIEELKYSEDGRLIDITYWSKYRRIGFEKYLYYEILPYNGLVSYEESSHKGNIKDYIGKDYRKFIFMRRQIDLRKEEYYSGEEEFFIVNDKALDIKKKDRTIDIKINY